MLRVTDVQGATCQQLCNNMCVFLQELGIARCSLIVAALAAKLNVWTPGWYDPDSW